MYFMLIFLHVHVYSYCSFFFLQGEGPLHGDQMPKFIEAQR